MLSHLLRQGSQTQINSGPHENLTIDFASNSGKVKPWILCKILKNRYQVWCLNNIHVSQCSWAALDNLMDQMLETPVIRPLASDSSMTKKELFPNCHSHLYFIIDALSLAKRYHLKINCIFAERIFVFIRQSRI